MSELPTTFKPIGITRADKRLAALVFLVSFSVFATFHSGRIDFYDGDARFFVTERLVYPSTPEEHGYTVQGANGHWYTWYGYGQPVLAIPFYLIGRTLVHLTRTPTLRALIGNDAEHLRYSDLPGERVAVTYLNPIATALAAALLVLLCIRLGASRRASVASALIFAFASLAMPHARSSFEHPLEELAVVGLLFALTAEPSWKSRAPLYAGLIIGYAGFTRESAFVLGLVYAAGRLAVRHPDRRLAGYDVLRAGLAALPLFALTLYTFWYRFHAIVPPSPISRFVTSPLTGLAGLLVSPGKSLFLYSPTLLLGIAGLAETWRRSRHLVVAMIVAWVLYLGVHSRVTFWHGDWCWGPRYLLALVPLMIPPVALALDRYKTRAFRAFAIATVGLALLVNTGSILFAYQCHYARQHYEPWFYMRTSELYFNPRLSPLIGQWEGLPYVYRALGHDWDNIVDEGRANWGSDRGNDDLRQAYRCRVIDLWPVHAWHIAPGFLRPLWVLIMGFAIAVIMRLSHELLRAVREGDP